MTISKTKVLVVLSGGQDSTTCLFWAKAYFNEVHAVTFDYGQRHAREIQAARDVAKLAGVASHEVVGVGPILSSTSPLTSDNELELYTDHDSMAAIIGDRVEKTFVPMRNALFLTLAANRAVCLGITNLVTGVCQADNANYPDCREDFIQAQEAAINEALGCNNFAIYAPLMNLTKAQSIELALSLSGKVEPAGATAVFSSEAYLALGFSHTAYDGQYPPVGKDHASVLRAFGFEQAGVPDPLVIRAVREGLMAFPGSANYADSQANTILANKLLRLKEVHHVGQ